MSAARGAANDLTSAGERALSEARVAAVHRFDDSALGRAAAPITKRLDYRVYRAFAAGRARAVAYSQLDLRESLRRNRRIPRGFGRKPAERPGTFRALSTFLKTGGNDERRQHEPGIHDSLPRSRPRRRRPRSRSVPRGRCRPRRLSRRTREPRAPSGSSRAWGTCTSASTSARRSSSRSGCS